MMTNDGTATYHFLKNVRVGVRELHATWTYSDEHEVVMESSESVDEHEVVRELPITREGASEHNDSRIVAWRKRYKAAGHQYSYMAHFIRRKHGIDWGCRQIPRHFQLHEGGPHFDIERGRIALTQGFLPIKERT